MVFKTFSIFCIKTCGFLIYSKLSILHNMYDTAEFKSEPYETGRSYLNANNFIFARVKIKIIRFAEDIGWKSKLHLDVGMDGTDVLVGSESIQFQSNIDDNTNTSVRIPVQSNSRTLRVTDRSRLRPFQLIDDVIVKSQSWHSTHQLATVCVSLRQTARLQNMILCTQPVAVLCWGQGAQAPKFWFYSNFA